MVRIAITLPAIVNVHQVSLEQNVLTIVLATSGVKIVRSFASVKTVRNAILQTEIARVQTDGRVNGVLNECVQTISMARRAIKRANAKRTIRNRVIRGMENVNATLAGAHRYAIVLAHS